MPLSAEHIAAAQRAFALYQRGRFQQALELAETLLTLSPPQLNLAAACARPLGLADKAEGKSRPGRLKMSTRSTTWACCCRNQAAPRKPRRFSANP
jgi:tetratricopeptide (TPR) repeat protein